MARFLRSAALATTLVVAGACLPSAGDNTTKVFVDLRHSKFVPSRLSVEAGSTVTFVIRNHDPIDHEFILGDEPVQDRHEKGTETQHGEIPGEVTVPSGETGVTTYEFKRPGTLLFGCHAPGHYEYGMRGVVTVV